MQTNNLIGSRLVALRGQTTQADFAARIGINVNTLRAYEKGRAQPGAETLAGICAKFSVSPSWLLLGEGPMAAGASLQRTQPEPVCDVDLMFVPMVEARMSAGTGSFETERGNERLYAFRSEFLNRKGSPAKMVLMRVSGDSMEPEIHNDDVVLIDQSQVEPRPGKLYAVRVGDLVYIKVIDSYVNGLLLKSINQLYPPITVDLRGDLAETVQILGKVIWLCREAK